MTLFVQDKPEYNVESTSTPDIQICLFIFSVVFKPVWPFRCVQETNTRSLFLTFPSIIHYLGTNMVGVSVIDQNTTVITEKLDHRDAIAFAMFTKEG